jgi:hypothetical protein
MEASGLMTELAEYRNRLIARYASQAEEVARMVEGLPEGRIKRELEPGGWSTHQVLFHLRDLEARAFVPRIAKILEQESPRLQRFNSEEWMDQHYDPGLAVGDMLNELKDLRSKGSRLIETLGSDGWSRTGEHPNFGVRTLQWWVEYAVSHFDEHLEHLARTLGT